MNTARVTTRGRLTIPAALRRRFNIKPGTRIAFIDEHHQIILKPITPKHLKGLRGSLKGTGVLKALMDDRKREREL